MNVIREIGMVSSLGTDAFTSLAAARAGISRPAALRTTHPVSADYLAGSPVIGHSVPGRLSEGFVGVAKALTLGGLAVSDLFARCSEAVPDRTGWYVVLSSQFLGDAFFESEAEFADEDEERIPPSAAWKGSTRDFARQLAGRTDHPGIKHALYYGGHAAVAQALRDAEHDLAMGMVDACVVGGIDSYVEPRSLQAAAAAQVLKTAALPTGFMPGEGAGFLLIERSHAQESRTAPIAVLAIGTGHDEENMLADVPPQGAGLSAAVGACLRQVADGQSLNGLGAVISDLNGEERRALEWGYCLVRLRPHYDFANNVWLPAASFGETGCAAGPIAMCMGVRALQRGYASGRRVLIVLSSEDGSKAAVCLGRDPGE